MTIGLFDFLPTGSPQAVIPVLVGPMTVIVPVLWGLAVAIVGRFLKLFTIDGMKASGRFFWHQKLFTIGLLTVIGGTVFGSANNWWRGRGDVSAATQGLEWSAFRGGPARSGTVAGSLEPTVDESVWSVKPRVSGTLRSVEFKTFYSSPAVVGNRVYVSAAEKGPLTDRGAILCLDAATGATAWAYSPGNFRATFSSPAVVYKRDKDGAADFQNGYVVCGEGLHFTTEARVTCLNLAGEKLWDHRTASHVESSPCISDGRVYIGAGDDGYYCFELDPNNGKPDGEPKILWHKTGADYLDCESSPIVHDGVFYAGLGEDKGVLIGQSPGGRAILALDAKTGDELWRLKAEYPVFGSPTIGYRVNDKGEKQHLLFIGMGNGNFIESAEQVRTNKVRQLREKGAGEDEIKAAEKALGPIGEVWCVDLGSFDREAGGPPTIAWKYKTARTVLGGIAFVPPAQGESPGEGRIYFGSRDGRFHCVSTAGQKLREPFDSGSAVLSSPAVGTDFVYFTTESGTLHCVRSDTLSPVFQMSLGGGPAMSSPALSNGHLYVGSITDGLRCLGRVTPPTPVWSSSPTGGLADRAPVPATGRFSARYPAQPDETFAVTAPLMALAEVITVEQVAQAVVPKRYVYVPVTRSGRHELLKFRHGQIAQPDGQPDPALWAVRFDQPIRVAPGGYAADLFVVEGGPLHDPARAGVLHVLDANSGQERWKSDLAPGGSGQLVVDARRLFVWTGPATLSCLDLDRDGHVLWSREYPGGGGVGQPSAFGGLVTITTDSRVLALDGDTGTVLWDVQAPARPLYGPLRVEGGLLLATEAGLFRVGIAGGAVEWSAKVGRIALPVVQDGEKAVVVADDARLHVLDLQTGLPWPVTRTHRGGDVPPTSIARVGPIQDVDKTVVPVLIKERVVYGAVRTAGSRSQTDLYAVTLPNLDEQPLVEPAPAEFRYQPVEPTRWCQTGFMGAIRTPLIFVEGQAYLATEKLGLTFLK